MTPSLQQLVESLLFSETDESTESGGYPLDRNYCITDVDAASLSELDQRFQQFIAQASELLASSFDDERSSVEDFFVGSASGDYQTEHDYIMTVNGHGCGYWDGDWEEPAAKILTDLSHRQTPIHAEVDDDGKIHLLFL